MDGGVMMILGTVSAPGLERSSVFSGEFSDIASGAQLKRK